MSSRPVAKTEAQPPADPCGALIQAARDGCPHSLGKLATRYRNYLLHMASASLSPALRAKVAPSDLVQETLLKMHELFPRFQGNNEDDLLKWLRHVLYFRAMHAVRQFRGTAARDLHREQALLEVAQPAEVQADVPALVDQAPTPCTTAITQEQCEQVRAALAVLPEDARAIVLWRVVDRLGFREIGERLGCSEDGARARWMRVVVRLRIRLDDKSTRAF